jgi:hypothetical protein
MSRHELIARRRVLTLLYASGVIACPLVKAAASHVPPGAATLAQGIDAAAIHAIAAQYRKRDTQAGLQDVSALLRDRSLGPEKLAAKLRAMVSDDYRHDRTVELSGWHLSRTEARVFIALSDYLS